MTLPSNSSMAFHPNNTVAKFTTALAQAVELTGDWEVALSEICIPANWYNITSADHWFEINSHRFTLPDKFFNNVKTVLETMMLKIKSKEELADSELIILKTSPTAERIVELMVKVKVKVHPYSVN